MNVEPFYENCRRDLFRYVVYAKGKRRLRAVVTCVIIEGVWALAAYRFGRALFTRGGSALILWPAFRAWELAVRMLTGIQLHVAARIGPGFYVGHHGAIYVGPGTVVGENSSIGQMCFVGPAAGFHGAAPRVGSRVYLGPGSKVIGDVEIGDRAVVGAGAVVLEDIPAGVTVVGNPARVVSKQGSDELIYLGEGDPLRTGSNALQKLAG